MELSVKLEAALVACLQAKTWPAYFLPVAVGESPAQIKPGEADEDLTQQYICARADNQAETEYPLDTGNFWWACEVELRTPAAVQTDETTSQLDKHQAVAAVLEAALLVDDLPEQMNAAALALGDGYELTVMAVHDRRPARDQSNDVYSSGWSFRVYCCSRAF